MSYLPVPQLFILLLCGARSGDWPAGGAKVSLGTILALGRHSAPCTGLEAEGDVGIRAAGHHSYPRAPAFASPPASRVELAEISSSPKQPCTLLPSSYTPKQITSHFRALNPLHRRKMYFSFRAGDEMPTGTNTATTCSLLEGACRSPATPPQELGGVKLPRTSAGCPCPPAAALPNESPLCFWWRLSHHEERAFITAEDRSGTEPSPGSGSQHKSCSMGKKQIHREPGAMPTASGNAGPGERAPDGSLKPTPRHSQGGMGSHMKGGAVVGDGMRRRTQSSSCHLRAVPVQLR